MNYEIYKNLILHAPFGYAFHKIILDKDGNPTDYEFLEVNPAFEKLTGLDATDIIGKTICQVIPAIIQSKFNWIRFYGEVAIHGGKREFEQYSEPLKRWYKVQVYSPEPYFFSTTFVDITEHKEVEDALKENVSLLQSITDTAQDAIIMIDTVGKVSFWNPASEKIFGYSSFQALGQNLHSLITPERYHKVHAKAFETFQKTGKGAAVNKTLVLQALTKFGHEIPIELSLSSIWTEDGWHAIGIVRDITERKQIEQELLAAKEKAEAANKAKSEFLANMSHEIRTPLNGVIGFTDLLTETSLNNEQKQYVEHANTSAHTLLEIINDILDLSKIEAGKLELDEVSTDLPLFVNKIIEVIRYSSSKKGLSLSLKIQKDIPTFIVVDPVRLRQILMNLLSNAVKFTEKGEVTLSISFKPNETNPIFTDYTFSVQDTGIGISEEQRTRLFQVFSQADASTTRKFGGTGLGLVISNLLVEKMGGSLNLNSQLGIGSNFYFTISKPFSHTKKHKEETQKESASNIHLLQHSPLILIAEDVPLNMGLLKRLLTNFLPNVIIVEAVDGIEAVFKAKEYKPHLILMDIQMPYKDGYTATREIRRDEDDIIKRVPIIALTAGALKSEKEKCLDAGMNDFLTKPIDKTLLKKTVIKYL
jgi:PAS domain S-box-containing protein